MTGGDMTGGEMTGDELYRVDGGFATLGPDLVGVLDALEARLLSWADACGARRMLFAPLLPVEDLETLDYFDNFPHLVLLVAPLEADSLMAGGGPAVREGAVPAAKLAAGRYALPSAACYSAYLHLRDSSLPSARYVTTVASCFRRESSYEGLRRLQGFRMREIVCIGSREAVQAHLSAFKPRILDLAVRLGLRLEVQPAVDPFFQPQQGRALMQQLFPVKEEFVHDGSLAVASVNFHRTFFGERCRIRLDAGGWASTGCVAFGLERWLAALLDAHRGDPGAVRAALAGVGDDLAGSRESR